MNEKIKVSIIVPAYNVEKYIRKCIVSILEQTHKNIEVIVINDGSTDGTQNILIELSKMDSRLVVVNTKNLGVSSARNLGLDVSKGDYIVFVDGDDYLAVDCVEYMLSLVNETGAEFCFSKKCYTKQGENQVENDSIQVLQNEDAIAMLLSPSVIVGCWNKIYFREFLVKNNLKFSTDLFYGEGLSFITTAAQLANFIGVGNRKVYYYRRNNETSATTKFDMKKIVNGEKSLKMIKSSIQVQSEKIDTMYYLHMALFSLGAVVKIRANNKNKYSKEYEYWRKMLILYSNKILTKKEVSIYRKLMLVGGIISPWMMMKLDAVRRNKISVNSVGK